MKFAVAVLCALFLTANTECLRVLQAASYRPKRAVGYFVSRHFAFSLACQCMQIILFFCDLPVWTAIFPCMLCGTVTMFVKRKCPIVYTKRIVRMLVLFGFSECFYCYFLPWFSVLSVPILTLISWTVMLPLEQKINKRYINSAAKKIVDSGVEVIAVVGSYGKTSVKTMLAELLDGAVCPDGSVNTPLGIAKFINEVDLSERKYLVLEFGARQLGDIAELCRYYSPQVGVVVGVCKQHIATFGNFDNVLKEKSTVLHVLPSGSVCVLNGADEIVRCWTNIGVCKKIISGSNIVVDVVKKDISGQTLAVYCGNDGCFEVKLPQIADYAANTFLLCAETCLALGQSIETTVANSAKITQMPHRMEVRRADGFFIVDDSYNAGIKGVESACRTLVEFDCKRVAIAQGIVECGKETRQLNVRCGRLLGETFHVVVVCGKNANNLAYGLRNSCTTVLFANDVDDATNKVLRYVGKGDLLYYQNDLPDVPIL